MDEKEGFPEEKHKSARLRKCWRTSLPNRFLFQKAVLSRPLIDFSGLLPGLYEYCHPKITHKENYNRVHSHTIIIIMQLERYSNVGFIIKRIISFIILGGFAKTTTSSCLGGVDQVLTDSCVPDKCLFVLQHRVHSQLFAVLCCYYGDGWLLVWSNCRHLLHHLDLLVLVVDSSERVELHRFDEAAVL